METNEPIMPSRTAPVSSLEAHLGYWLRYVSNQVSLAFGQKLAARDVSVAEWVVLRLLHDQALAPSALAERMGVTRGAISKLADKLAAKGLVVRAAPAEGDRRFQTLDLTGEGRALVPVLAALADKNDAEFFGDLDPQTRAVIEGAMKAIVRREGLTSLPLG